jgi:hypothetical protein
MTAGCGTLGDLMNIYGNLVYTWIHSYSQLLGHRISGLGWLSNIECLFLAVHSLRASELAKANITSFSWQSGCGRDTVYWCSYSKLTRKYHKASLN